MLVCAFRLYLKGLTRREMTKKRLSLIAVLLVLIGWPIVYIFIRTSGVPPLPQQENTAVAATSNDIPALENAVKTNPTFDNLVNLSTAYINKQMPGKSIDPLKKALQMKSNSAIAYNDLGVAYTMMQQYKEGIDACTKALQLDSTFQLAKNNLKWATGERDKVLAQIREQEASSAKKDIAYYSAYGLNYFRIGDYSKSIEIWSRIFELDPKNTGALNSIGTAFMMKGQTDDAIALFKKAVELEPGNQLAKNNLNWGLEEKANSK